MQQLTDSPVGSMFEDMYKSSTSMYISMGCALVWSIVYIYLMSIFAEQLAWCCVFLIQFGLFAGTIFSYMTWDKEMKKLEAKKVAQDYENMDDKSK